MLATMKMRMATTWGNDVELGLATELDNAHLLTTAELADLMTLTMRKMCDTVRAENERVIEADPPSAAARTELRDHERDRLEQLRAGRDRE